MAKTYLWVVKESAFAGIHAAQFMNSAYFVAKHIRGQVFVRTYKSFECSPEVHGEMKTLFPRWVRHFEIWEQKDSLWQPFKKVVEDE